MDVEIVQQRDGEGLPPTRKGELLERYLQKHGGDLQGMANYKRLDMPLSADHRQTVAAAAYKLGVDLKHTPTGETAQVLLRHVQSYALNEYARLSLLVKEHLKRGESRQAKAAAAKAQEWQMEEIRARLALQGKLRFN